MTLTLLLTDMTTYKNVCTGTPIPGRSVRVSCQDATTYTGSFPATTVTKTHETVIVDDPTPTFIAVDSSTFTFSTKEGVSSDTGNSKPKKHHKHTTMVAVSETTYFQSFPTTPMSTITLVPAPQKTDDGNHDATMNDVCDEHPDLDVCNDIQDKNE